MKPSTNSHDHPPIVDAERFRRPARPARVGAPHEPR